MDFGIASVIPIIVAVILLVDIWRSPAPTGHKVVWSIFAVILSVITGIVWLVWGRKKAYESGTTSV